jgi:hypothetical protein
MEDLTGRVAGGSVDCGMLGALLDKLVAMQMDLEPVCGSGRTRAPVMTGPEAIASACEVLYCAIADMQSIIGQLDGLLLKTPADPAKQRNSNSPYVSRELA